MWPRLNSRGIVGLALTGARSPASVRFNVAAAE